MPAERLNVLRQPLFSAVPATLHWSLPSCSCSSNHQASLCSERSSLTTLRSSADNFDHNEARRENKWNKSPSSRHFEAPCRLIVCQRGKRKKQLSVWRRRRKPMLPSTPAKVPHFLVLEFWFLPTELFSELPIWKFPLTVNVIFVPPEISGLFFLSGTFSRKGGL